MTDHETESWFTNTNTHYNITSSTSSTSNDISATSNEFNYKDTTSNHTGNNNINNNASITQKPPIACFWSSHTADLSRLRPFGPGQGRGKRWGRLKSDAAERRENELKLRFELAQTHARTLLAHYDTVNNNDNNNNTSNTNSNQHIMKLRTAHLTYQIGKPYDHLTSACYASFRKFVRECSHSNNNDNQQHETSTTSNGNTNASGHVGNWTVSRREANAVEKAAHGEKRKGPVYFTIVTFAVPLKYQYQPTISTSTALSSVACTKTYKNHHTNPASEFLLPHGTVADEEDEEGKEMVPDLVSPYQEVMSTVAMMPSHTHHQQEDEEDVCASYLLSYHSHTSSSSMYKKIKVEDTEEEDNNNHQEYNNTSNSENPQQQQNTTQLSSSATTTGMSVSIPPLNNFVEVAPYTYIFADDNGIGAGYYKRYPSRAATASNVNANTTSSVSGRGLMMTNHDPLSSPTTLINVPYNNIVTTSCNEHTNVVTNTKVSPDMEEQQDHHQHHHQLASSAQSEPQAPIDCLSMVMANTQPLDPPQFDQV